MQESPKLNIKNEVKAHHDSHFSCTGDYCNIIKRNMIPTRLAPVVSILMKKEEPKVSKKLILREWAIIKEEMQPFQSTQ